MKLECVHIDTCLSDYFGGDARPHVQIPVYKGMSFKAIKADIHSELNQGAVGGNDSVVWDDSGDDGDRWYKKAHAAVNRMKPAVKGQRSFFNDLEEQTDDSESVYAYFIFVEAD